MKYFVIKLNEEYKEISRFECVLTAYLPKNSPELDENKKHPCFLIMPGGGYMNVSDRENEPIALKLLGEGYAVFALEYSTVLAGAKFPAQLLQACFAMKHIVDNASKYYIDTSRIFAMGFSAGGHLCASLGLMYSSKYVTSIMPNYKIARPTAMVLCYPVITSGQYAERNSFNNLLGEEGSLDEVSLEKAVNKNSPPVFIWHTYDDEMVPVQNALLLADAYAKNNVPCELHIFEKGVHGLSLANKLTASKNGAHMVNENAALWFELLLNYLKRFESEPMQRNKNLM